MKQLTTLISALLFLVIGVSQVWALPACPSSGYFHNCYGAYVWANGNKYVGAFKDDVRNGQGTYTWEDGNKYVGNYKDDKRTGQGTFTFASGAKWVGAWENSKLNGHAITYYADGSINKEGIFKDDRFLYTEKRSKPVITPSTDSELDKHKEFCEEIGFTPKTEGFGDCVLKLMDKD